MDAFNILLCGAAAVVSHTVKAHDAAPGILDFSGTALYMFLQLPGPGTVFKGNPESSHRGTIIGGPGKGFTLQSLFMTSRTHEYVIVHSRFFQNLRQHAVVAEAVHVISGLRSHSQLLLKIPLTVQPLAHIGLPARRITVRLNPPAAHDYPAALFDPFPDFLKHGGFVFLHPLIVGCRAACKKEVVILLHPVQGRTEGGLNLLIPLLPLPEPYRIQVGVADHI